MMKEFPLDLPSVVELGLEHWRSRLSWPVSWNRFLEIERDTKRALNEIIRQSPDFVAELLVVSYKMYIEYANLIHALSVLQELQRRSCQPVISANNRFYGDLSKGMAPDTSLFDRTLFRGITRKRYRNALKRNLRTLKNNLVFSPLHFVPKALTSNTYAVDKGGALAEFIAGRERNRVLFRDPERWYSESRNGVLAKNKVADLHAAAVSIASAVEQLATKYGVDFPQYLHAYLLHSTQSALEKTARLLGTLEQNLARHKPVNLFLGSNRTVFLRALSLAARKNGGSVTGFMHGEPLVYEWDKLSWLEFPLDDRFYTYTENIARELQDTSQRFTAPNGWTPDISGQGTTRFTDIFVTSNGGLTKKVRRVMIVPNCFTLPDILSQASSFPEIMQLQIENMLIENLHQAGFEVLYKKHPDGTQRGRRFTLFPNVDIVYDRFEEVMQLADAFLFYHTRTSTFGPALCTAKPIVIIDGGWEKIHAQMLSLLKKRCNLVKASVSDADQILVDRSELVDAVQDCSKALNTDFRETYLV